jgi:hypothetical protein
MSSILGRIQNWVERDDAKLAATPTRWLIARALLGLLMAIKGGVVLMHAADGWHYALGPMLILGGLAFAVESAQALTQRVKNRRPTAVELE